MDCTVFWGVASMKRRADDGTVFEVTYTVCAQSSQASTGFEDMIELPAPTPEEKIPYEQLTEQLTTQWVKDKLGADVVSQIEDELKAKLAEKERPTFLVGTPWLV